MRVAQVVFLMIGMVISLVLTGLQLAFGSDDYTGSLRVLAAIAFDITGEQFRAVMFWMVGFGLLVLGVTLDRIQKSVSTAGGVSGVTLMLIGGCYSMLVFESNLMSAGLNFATSVVCLVTTILLQFALPDYSSLIAMQRK